MITASEVVIRKFVGRDIEPVRQLIASCVSVIADRDLLESRLRSCQRDPSAEWFVAESDGVIHGFAGAILITDPCDGLIVYLKCPILRTSAFGEVGEKLVAEQYKLCKEYQVKYAEVLVSSLEAEKEYQKHGFTQKTHPVLYACHFG